MKKITTLLIVLLSCASYSQSIQELVNQINQDALELGLNEFTGEQSTVVNGNTVTIRNRRHGNNDVAANYIKEKFEAMDNITVEAQTFNQRGINVIGTQLGKTNPDDIYIVCAHYDSVTDYCASDNATGTIAVLEIAKILSTQCLDNTIVYALWDEEEINLLGSSNYAARARNRGDNILGVLNIDMMGFDRSGTRKFDIDVRDVAGSIAMKNDLENIYNNSNLDLDLEIVNPGTPNSDHNSFWEQGFSAVLVGESWETSNQSPHWHQPTDRTLTIDLPYYTELTKFIMTYLVTKGSLLSVDNTVEVSNGTILANETSANYQWINCDTGTEISGATNRTFTPSGLGTYAVKVSSGSCIEVSECVEVDTLGLDAFTENEVNLFPNPVKTVLTIEMANRNEAAFNLYNTAGKLVLSSASTKASTTLNLKSLSTGVYFLNVTSEDKSGTFKIIKE